MIGYYPLLFYLHYFYSFIFNISRCNKEKIKKKEGKTIQIDDLSDTQAQMEPISWELDQTSLDTNEPAHSAHSLAHT